MKKYQFLGEKSWKSEDFGVKGDRKIKGLFFDDLFYNSQFLLSFNYSLLPTPYSLLPTPYPRHQTFERKP